MCYSAAVLQKASQMVMDSTKSQAHVVRFVQPDSPVPLSLAWTRCVLSVAPSPQTWKKPLACKAACRISNPWQVTGFVWGGADTALA